METKIIKIDPINPENERVAEAARFIKNRGLVIFPTETVYGIGADAMNGKACERIFKAKGRPQDNPLIVHVDSFEMAEKIGGFPEDYISRIKKIWPSPITFIVKAKKGLPNEVTAGLDTVAIRMPAHPVALALIKESGVPIAAPSANPSKKPSATNADQAKKYFNKKVDCIIDSGRTFFGLESTIIDLGDFTLLRPGPFTLEEIEKMFGKVPKSGEVAKGLKSEEVARSPGTKYAHYAPDTPLLLFSGKIDSLPDILEEAGVPEFTFLGSSESCKKLSSAHGCSTIELGSSRNEYEIAKNLYDALILLDSMKVGFGIIESFDEKGVGLAIMNRVRKAASNREFGNAKELQSFLDDKSGT